MLRRLAIAGLAAVLMTACTSDDEPSPTPSTLADFGTTTTALPTTPVIGRVLSPDKGSVQGSGGRGMVVVLSFTARDPSVLPAELRGALPAGAKPGRNPAFPGLVVGLSTTGTPLGGPSANLANLFQVVTPAAQLDGSKQVTAVWINTQADFGSDADATLVAYVVSEAAPDVIPETQANIDVIANPVEVTFRVSGGTGAASPAAAASGSSTTTVPGTATTGVRPTTTTSRPTATTVAPVTTVTTQPATTTTVRATTPTTLCALPGILC